MLNYNLPKSAFNLPWFMFDIDNKVLITSPITPGDISDTKDIILTETPIPGQNYAPVTYGGGGNNKIAFTLPSIKRNNSIGNILFKKQFEGLRNRVTNLTNIFSSQFTPNPKVLYNWGIGNVPLIYWVKKCDFVHKEGWANSLSNPQYSDVAIELWLDESDPLYKGEEIFRKFMSLTGMVLNNYDIAESNLIGKRPY